MSKHNRLDQKQLQLGICCSLLSWVYSGVVRAEVLSPVPATSSYGQVAQLPLPNAGLLQLRNVQVAPEGLLLAINGNPQTSIQRIIGPDRIVIDLLATNVSLELRNTVIPVNRYGVKQARIGQFQQAPAIARIVLDLDPNDPNSKLNWQTNFNPARGGLLLSPVGVVPVPVTPTNPTPPVNNGAPAIIQGLVFTNTGKLIIQGNQPLFYRGSEDAPSNTYNISVVPAQISPQLQRPSLPANSPIERVRLSQVGNSVFIGVKTSPGWQIRETDHTNPQEIGLQLLKVGTTGSVPQTNNPPTNVPPTNRGRGVVVIDPGHGGPDVGAIGNGIYEKNIVLPISLFLGQALQQMGYVVVYTRTTDIDLDLEPRVNIAQQVKADAFVSIHANSLETRLSSVSGVETYFAPGATQGQRLAQLVHSQIIRATNADDRGVRSARFYVIRNTTMPAILVETGFVTNAEEAANLNNRAYQEQMAAAIARGVDQFLRSR